jgi:hypothetical protein
MRRHRCCGAARRLPTSSRPSRVTVAIESADCASMMPAPATTTARPRNSPTRAVMEPPEDVRWSTSLLPAGTQRRTPQLVLCHDTKKKTWCNRLRHGLCAAEQAQSWSARFLRAGKEDRLEPVRLSPVLTCRIGRRQQRSGSTHPKIGQQSAHLNYPATLNSFRRCPKVIDTFCCDSGDQGRTGEWTQ